MAEKNPHNLCVRIFERSVLVLQVLGPFELPQFGAGPVVAIGLEVKFVFEPNQIGGVGVAGCVDVAHALGS